MSNRNSDSASFVSGPPLSPFSSAFSVHSEVTSDAPPDLGDFTSVFRALNELQNQNRQETAIRDHTAPESRFEGSEDDSDAAHSTVWDRDPVRSYLSSDQDDPSKEFQSEDEDVLLGPEEDHELGDLPTLGALDAALMFLAGEHEKLVAKAEARESHNQPIVSPKRKRRRKRKNIKGNEGGVNTIAPTPDLSYSSNELSSSPERTHPLPTPGPGHLQLKYNLSTPNLLVPSSATEHIRIELRKFAAKLEADFPDEAGFLEKVPKLSVNSMTGELFADPRGPPTDPSHSEPFVHVFIDHSNILIGFLMYIKHHPPTRNRKLDKWLISHASLALLLERGRPVVRRVMAASSPLHQSMDKAQALGYEVRVYARVPNTDSDSGGQGKSALQSRTTSNLTSNVVPSAIAQTGGRIRRYREQGVDELLQLKLHQAIVEIDRPPPGSTIVLATGDGAVGEFNQDGFVGCVRTALKRGWRVELYAWEDGLSRAWTREFGAWGDQFKIILLEKYGADLLLG